MGEGDGGGGEAPGLEELFFFLMDYSSGDDLSLGRTCTDNSLVGVRPAAR